MEIMATKAHLTEIEAAEFLGVSVHWLRAARYSKRPDGPPYVKLGSNVRYRRADLEAWIEACRVNPAEARNR